MSTRRLIVGAPMTWHRSGCAQRAAPRSEWARGAVLITSLLVANLLRPASAQAPAPWGGWVQCRFDVRGTGYAHQEVQTWTITGPPVMQSTVEVYPASWSVTGQGTLKKTTDASTEAADWAIAVPATVAQIGITPHADRFTIQRWTAQRIGRGGLTGKDVLTALSAQPRVTSMTLDVDEQPFATIDVDLKSTQTNGSSTPAVSGTVGPIRPRDAQGKGNCAWQFARGGIATLAPPQPTTTTSAATASSSSTVMLGGASGGTLVPAPTTTSTTTQPAATIGSTNTTSGATTIGSVGSQTGFTAVGSATVSPRTITLAPFTATGSSATRTITVSGFTAVGSGAAIAPRTITLAPWISAGP